MYKTYANEMFYIEKKNKLPWTANDNVLLLRQ